MKYRKNLAYAFEVSFCSQAVIQEVSQKLLGGVHDSEPTLRQSGVCSMDRAYR